MPSAPPADQFWLLSGPVPSGPFTVSEIHAKLASGDTTWETPACPVGGAEWRPLVQTPGVGPGARAETRSPETAAAPPADPAPAPAAPATSADTGAVDGPPQSEEPLRPRNDPARSSPKKAAEAVGGIAALLLVGGLIWGAKCAEEAIRGPKTPTVPAVSQTKLDPAVVARFANKDAAGKAGAPQAPSVPSLPPPDHAPDPARRLVGSWRWTAPNGYASTFSFEGNGAFTYYVTGANPLANLPAAAAGEAVGRWSVRDGTLFLEFTGGTTPTTDALFRGSTGRSPLRFVSDSTVQLSGVEGDAVTRTYTRIR